MKLDLGPGDFVLDGDPATSPQKGGGAPKFSADVYCVKTAGWIEMVLGVEVGLSSGDFVLDGDPAPLPKGGRASLPNFWPISIVAKRLDASRCHLVCEVGLSPGYLLFDGNPSLSPKRGRNPSQIFGPCLLRPNGCMDQDATWYKGRPWPRRHCVRWGPCSALPKKRAESSPQFSAQVYCGQTAGWIKVALGMEVGLGQATLYWMGTQLLSPKKGQSPPILAHVCCGQTAGWIKTPLGTEVDLGPGHFVLDGFPAIGERGTAVPLFSAHAYCGHGRPSQLLLSSCYLSGAGLPRLS